MTELEFIKKWQLRHDLIAAKIGISKQTFRHRWTGRTSFSELETNKLSKVFKELLNDISKIK